MIISPEALVKRFSTLAAQWNHLESFNKSGYPDYIAVQLYQNLWGMGLRHQYFFKASSAIPVHSQVRDPLFPLFNLDDYIPVSPFTL